MLVAQILKHKGHGVFTITPEETLASGAALLFARGVGAMVVLEEGKVVGILSERDLVRAVAQGGPDTLSQPVRRFMTADVVFAKPTETVEILMERMTDRRVRHLPVCDDEQLVGIVSIGDLVKSRIAETEHEAETLKTYIVHG